MPTHPQIFVTLPVKDLQRSVAFFAKLGYAFDPQRTGVPGRRVVHPPVPPDRERGARARCRRRRPWQQHDGACQPDAHGDGCAGRPAVPPCPHVASVARWADRRSAPRGSTLVPGLPARPGDTRSDLPRSSLRAWQK